MISVTTLCVCEEKAGAVKGTSDTPVRFSTIIKLIWIQYDRNNYK